MLSIPFQLVYITCLILILFNSCYCQIAVSGISKTSGLTNREKNALLDDHNRLRSLQAQGKVQGQPPAADMTRLEWSDKAARHAQDWADQCQGPVHGNTKRYGDGQNLALDTNRGTLLKRAMNGWFNKEYPLYTYGSQWFGSAGHYTQIVTAYSHLIGCGANKCPGNTYGHLICNFHVGGNMYGKPPFQKGTACTKCPTGYGYCKDSLCTSSRVCSRSDRSCVCKVNRRVCAQHGTFMANSCECRCQAGYTGLNCEKTCKDHPFKGCPQRKRNGQCKPSTSNQYYVDTVLNCPASCGFCKAAGSKSSNRGSTNRISPNRGSTSRGNSGSNTNNLWIDENSIPEQVTDNTEEYNGEYEGGSYDGY